MLIFSPPYDIGLITTDILSAVKIGSSSASMITLFVYVPAVLPISMDTKSETPADLINATENDEA
jgi:hypothetical protein